MIRQICPHCFQTVELPDSAAGTDAPCPKCAKSIPVPGSYTPTVDPAAGPAVVPAKEPTPVPPPVSPSSEWNVPAPPPGFVPPKESVKATDSPKVEPPPTPERFTHSAGFSISPAVPGWVPVACLTLAFLATFLSWVGSFPGDVRVYTQNPWQALFATFTANTLPDELLLDEKPIAQKLYSSWWLLPYFPVLIFTLIFAWVERIIRHPDPATIPGPLAWVPKVWPRRYQLLGGLSLLLLLLVGIQTTRGLGLEVAIRDLVAEKFAKTAEEADTTLKKTKLAVNSGKELAQFGIQATIARDTALALHVIAFLAAATLVWLDHRGAKQHPRVVGYW